MRLKLTSLLVLSYVLCSGFICTGSQIHKAKLANADIATTLNSATKTIIELTNQGSMSAEEERVILPKLNDATRLSDQLQVCTNTVATGSIVGCAQPLFSAIQQDMSAVSFGLKDPKAQATYASVIGAITSALAALKAAGGLQ